MAADSKAGASCIKRTLLSNLPRSRPFAPRGFGLHLGKSGRRVLDVGGEVRELLHLPDLEVENVDTVGGYIIQRLGRWPRPGDALPIGPYNARVLSIQQRRVGQVLLTPMTTTAKAEGAERKAG